MRLRELTPIIWTEQLQETADFYTKVLNFKLDNLDMEHGWGHLSKEGVQIMFSLPRKEPDFTKAKFTGTFYIYVNGINELWEELEGIANICYPIADHAYGMREFTIYDNNGYRLQFAQAIND